MHWSTDLKNEDDLALEEKWKVFKCAILYIKFMINVVIKNKAESLMRKSC